MPEIFKQKRFFDFGKKNKRKKKEKKKKKLNHDVMLWDKQCRERMSSPLISTIMNHSIESVPHCTFSVN